MQCCLGVNPDPESTEESTEACGFHPVIKVITFNCEQLFCFVLLSIYIFNRM